MPRVVHVGKTGLRAHGQGVGNAAPGAGALGEDRCNINDMWEYFDEHLPTEFKVELCGELLKQNHRRKSKLKIVPLGDRDACEFHVHGEGIEKCARLKAEDF